jgi:hypothetical protein
LAEELLAKEQITLPDLVRILGERPFPLKESVREYLQELEERKLKDEQAANTPVDNNDDGSSEKAKEEQEESNSNNQEPKLESK